MELRTLQYPRHVHQDGQWKIVSSAAECDAALETGWVLSPGDAPRATASVPVEPVTVLEADPPPASEDLPAVEPVAPRKKPGRPPKAKE